MTQFQGLTGLLAQVRHGTHGLSFFEPWRTSKCRACNESFRELQCSVDLPS
jgi:hypothetical protein